MSQPIIEVENLSKKYRLGAIGATTLRDDLARFGRHLRGLEPEPDKGEFWALRDVSFSIRSGEVVGIIGRNGAGKSTLLKILSRITEPTSGRAVMHGRVASLLEVGTGFHPDLSGRENIFLNGAILGMKRSEIAARFDEIVAFAEVEKFIDTPVKHYSSGMYVRLAFAVAAHLEPEVLVVDEVLAVGDAQFQKRCLGKMREISAQDRSVLLVSHNMGVVSEMCERAIWLQNGIVLKSGNAKELVQEYLSASASKASLHTDISKVQRQSHLGHTLRIMSASWLTGLPLKHGEPAVLRLDCVANRAAEDVSVGFGFASLEGSRLISFDTDLENGDRPSFREGEKFSVEFRIPSLQVGPSSYLIDIGARSGDFGALDYLPGALEVEVLPGSRSPGHILRSAPTVRCPIPVSWLKS